MLIFSSYLVKGIHNSYAHPFLTQWDVVGGWDSDSDSLPFLVLENFVFVKTEGLLES